MDQHDERTAASHATNGDGAGPMATGPVNQGAISETVAQPPAPEEAPQTATAVGPSERAEPTVAKKLTPVLAAVAVAWLLRVLVKRRRR